MDATTGLFSFPFPPELAIAILSFLSPKDVETAKLVNKTWRNFCEDKGLWKKFAPCREVSEPIDGDWKKAVKIFLIQTHFENIAYSGPTAQKRCRQMVDGTAIRCLRNMVKLCCPGKMLEPGLATLELNGERNTPAFSFSAKDQNSKKPLFLSLVQKSIQRPSHINHTFVMTIYDKNSFEKRMVLSAISEPMCRCNHSIDSPNWNSLLTLIKTKQAVFKTAIREFNIAI